MLTMSLAVWAVHVVALVGAPLMFAWVASHARLGGQAASCGLYHSSSSSSTGVTYQQALCAYRLLALQRPDTADAADLTQQHVIYNTGLQVWTLLYRHVHAAAAAAVGAMSCRYVLTGMLGVSMSYHRQLSHKSFRTPKVTAAPLI